MGEWAINYREPNKGRPPVKKSIAVLMTSVCEHLFKEKRLS